MSEDLSSYKQLKRSINLTTTASKPSSTTTINKTSSTSIKHQISIDSENPFNDYYLIDELEKSSNATTTTTSSLKTSLKQLKYLLEFGSTSTSTSTTNNRNSSSSNNTISSSSNDPTTTSSSIITSNRNSSTSSASTSTSASASSSRQNLAADAAAVAVVDELSHHGGSSRSAYVSQLNELIEFCSSCYDDGDVDARNLVELALVKKLNYLSSAVLGLERRILPSFLLVPPNNASAPATTANNSGTSMLSLNECYARYDRLEADLGPTHLVRVSIDAASLMLLKNLGELNQNESTEFICMIYEFESNYKGVATALHLDDDLSTQQNPPTTPNTPKTEASKKSTWSSNIRSCSADPRLIAARKQQQYNHQQSNKQLNHHQLKIFTHVLDLDDISNISSSSDSELHNHNHSHRNHQRQPTNSQFKLGEKCLRVSEISLNGIDQNHRVVHLHSKCAKFVVVLVKRVNEWIRETINYDYYEINSNLGLRLLATSMTTSNTNKNEMENSNGRSKERGGGLYTSSSSSNVLRRMFKSKSKTRNNLTSATSGSNSNLLSSPAKHRNHSTAANSITNSTATMSTLTSPLRIELIDKELGLFLNPSTTMLDVDSLRHWFVGCSTERPIIRDDKLVMASSPSTPFELINIYLGTIGLQSREAKRRSKLDQHRMEKTRQSNGERNDDEEFVAASNLLYFIKCLVKCDGVGNEWSFVSRLFRANENINDLFQVRIDQPQLNWHHAELKIHLELYKLNPRNLQTKLVAANPIYTIKLDNEETIMSKKATLSRKRRYEIALSNVTNTGGGDIASTITKLKLKLYHVKTSLPSTFESTAIMRLKPGNDTDLQTIMERIFDDQFHDIDSHLNHVVLIPKFLELIAHLSSSSSATKNLSSSSINQDATRNGSPRNALLIRVFDALLRTIRLTSESDFFTFFLLQAPLQQNYQDKHLIKCLINVMRLVFESEDNLGVYESTMSEFGHLVGLLVALAQHSNSQYELKYNLNDLFMRLMRQLKASVSKKRASLERLQLSFVNQLSLNDLFSPSELSSLLIKILEPTIGTSSDEENEEDRQSLVLRPWLRIFAQELFKSNHLFRERSIEHILNLIQSHQKDRTPINELSQVSIDLIKNILKNRSRVSKSIVDSLIRTAFGPLIHTFHSQVDNKPYETLSKNAESITDTLLCLVELIDLVLNNRLLTRFDQDKAFVEADLSRLFTSLSVYFSSSQTLFLPGKHQLSARVDSVLLNFAKHIQKSLLKSVVNRSVSDPELDRLMTSYFRLLFSFISQPNVDHFGLGFAHHKMALLETASQFWRSLNVRLKRSAYLCEFILVRLCRCWAANVYFRAVNNSVTVKQPVVLPIAVRQEHLVRFNQAIVAFMNDVYNSNVLPAFDAMVYGYSLFFLARFDKLRKQCKKYAGLSLNADFSIEDEIFAIECSNLRSYAKCILLILEKPPVDTTPSNKNLPSQRGKESIESKLRQCLDYNLLKEVYEVEETVSCIEKFLIIIKLLRQVGNEETNEREPVLISSSSSSSSSSTSSSAPPSPTSSPLPPSLIDLSECRRKLKLLLLDDLYELNKSEKNFLHMSFIRKQQGDLLEWSSEPELKEILYLKSLKKFAINSLQEKFTQQENNAHLNDYYKSLEAGKIKPKESLPTTLIVVDTASSQVNQDLVVSIQFEICKKLCEHYEKLDDNYLKFTRIMNAESKFAQLCSMSKFGQQEKTAAAAAQQENGKLSSRSGPQHHGHLYFRIGVFGRSLKFDSVQNQYFLYKHRTYEMLSNIQSLIINKLAYGKWAEHDDNALHKVAIHNVSLLHHNQEPESRLKESQNGCYLQICALNRIERPQLAALIDETSDDTESHLDDVSSLSRLTSLVNSSSSYHFFYFDRPFYLTNAQQQQSASSITDTESKESVENLWIERTILVQDKLSLDYEPMTSFNEIHSTYKLMLNPIRNAIADINEKTKELKHFVVQFTSQQQQQQHPPTTNHNQTTTAVFNTIHSLQPLTMRLLGCLDARVNGGLIKYVRELLNADRVSSKKPRRKALLHQLYLSIKDQLNVLESGLSIHDRILRDVEAKYSKELSGLIDSNATSTVNFNDSTPASSSNNSSAKSYQKTNYVEHIKHMNELNRHLIECLKLVTLELNERWAKFCC